MCLRFTTYIYWFAFYTQREYYLHVADSPIRIMVNAHENRDATLVLYAMIHVAMNKQYNDSYKFEAIVIVSSIV